MARSPAALLLLLLTAAAGASHGAATTAAELYWKIALPTSPMPGAIRDLINPVGSGSVSSSQEEDTAVGSVFFLEKDLFPGSKMTLMFTRATASAPLLPRGRADAVPFASDRLDEILSMLSVPAGSPAADAMRATLAKCEAAPLPGEVKRCATSLESMVEFAAAGLGTRDVHAVSTELMGGGDGMAASTARQAYTVEGVRPVRVVNGEMVACHGMRYAYVVFGCHTTMMKAYAVALAGEDGSTRVEAVAACHTDAASGIAIKAYRRLGIAPGSVPVCHFLPEDDTLWLRN
uniref:BURP domain-containing protein n=1 Tax=Leersia perrieri TaxID=77586 RepID=A0A0D9WE03_9ORYZ